MGRYAGHGPCSGTIALVAALAFASAHFSPAQAETCGSPPPPVVDLDIPRFYADPRGSVIDPARMALHDAAVAPLADFLQRVTSAADKALTRPTFKSQTEAAQCALAWIEAWARGNAWLGAMAQPQAEYQRKWDLGGVALAYLKVRRFATPDQRRAIEPWLVRFADAARAFFDDPRRKRNNHWYWLGLGVAATALAADSPRHWEMARGIMADAARDISADGTLPQELARGSRAIHYHAFSVMPLVVLAELGLSRGEAWYDLGDGALHRLVATTLSGLENPGVFRDLAKVPQQPDPGAGAGWLFLYEQRFADRLWQGWPNGRPNMKPGHRWLGGNVLVLVSALK